GHERDPVRVALLFLAALGEVLFEIVRQQRPAHAADRALRARELEREDLDARERRAVFAALHQQFVPALDARRVGAEARLLARRLLGAARFLVRGRADVRTARVSRRLCGLDAGQSGALR